MKKLIMTVKLKNETIKTKNLTLKDVVERLQVTEKYGVHPDLINIKIKWKNSQES